MPEWSWLSGHIFHFYAQSRKLPREANVDLTFNEIALEFQDDEMFLIDMWPLSEPMLTVFNPEAANEVCQKANLPKAKKNETMLLPITGGNNLLSMNGDLWKTWRTLFNPGFSSGAIMEQVPQIVKYVSAFCDALRKNAGGGLVFLDPLTTEMTFQVILKISL